MNTAEKLVEKATKKAGKSAKKVPTVKELKKKRKAVDIANPLTTGLVVNLGPGSVRKMREFDRLRTQKDEIESKMEAIKLYFAKKCGTAEIGLLGASGKAVYRNFKEIDAYTVKANTVRQCTISKAPATED